MKLNQILPWKFSLGISIVLYFFGAYFLGFRGSFNMFGKVLGTLAVIFFAFGIVGLLVDLLREEKEKLREEREKEGEYNTKTSRHGAGIRIIELLASALIWYILRREGEIGIWNALALVFLVFGIVWLLENIRSKTKKKEDWR